MVQHARTHADLNAMLIGQKTVPKGCHVLNVSPQGMLLQCEPDGRLLTFRDGDPIDIHLSVQHAGNRKKFSIPAVVNHVDIKRIDVVFQHPNAELLKLIEAYRVSDAHMMEASIAHSKQEAGNKVSELPKTSKGPLPAYAEDASTKQSNRLSPYAVLLTVILSVCIAAGTYLYTSGIDNRLSVLETITINQTNELAEIRSRIFSASLQEGRYASLNARLQALTDAFGSLEDKLDSAITNEMIEAYSGKPVSLGRETPVTIISQTPSRDTAAIPRQTISQAPSTRPDQQDTADRASDGLDSQPRSTTGQVETVSSEEASSSALQVVANIDSTVPSVPDKPAETRGTSRTSPQMPDNTITSRNPESASMATGVRSGPWIINLLSSINKRDTDRLAMIAEGQGIQVVQNKAIVKGKEYWRLQITGFKTAAEAKEYAIPVKKTLGIKEVWIFKQKG